MIGFKGISGILLIILISNLFFCKKARNIPIKTVNKGILLNKSPEIINRTSLGIIKESETPRISTDRKRVTFADQVLDDTVGLEPLDSNNINIEKSKDNIMKMNSSSESGKSAQMSIFLLVIFVTFYLLVLF